MNIKVFFLIGFITCYSSAETKEQEQQRYCRRMAEMVQNQEKKYPNPYANEYLRRYCVSGKK